VYPWQNLAVSLYYQRAADFRSGSRFDGFIARDLYNDDRVDVLFRTENIGLSAGFKLGDKISVGGSVRATRVRADTLQRVTLVFPFGDGFFVGRVVNDASIDSSEVKTTFNAGILVRPTSKLSLGAVYKKGADLAFSQTLTSVVDAESLGPFADPPERQSIRITVPDVFGGGVAIKPTDQLTILADLVRIQYSDADLGPNGQNGYQRFGQGGREPLDDATEFHGGLEYTWTSGSDWIFSLRGGYYRDPDHDGLRGVDSDQNHATFGGGIVVKNRLQVDVAANLASGIKEGLISFVVRF
jgi:long-subunit fatty acid transport protein